MGYRGKAIAIGLFAGAFLGAALAWIATNDQANESGEPVGLAALGPGDYVQLGISLLTLVRQFSSMLKKQ